MSEDFLTRSWADGHKHFSDQIADAFGALVATVRVSLDRLNRYEFDAPWKRDLARERSRRTTTLV